MAGTGRSLQQLCRAAFSLCNAASTSTAGSSSAAHLAGGSLRAAAAGGAGHQHMFAAGGLQQLVRVSECLLLLAGKKPTWAVYREVPTPGRVV